MTVEQWIKINQSIRVSRDMKEPDWFDSNIQDVQKGKFYITIPYQKANPLILSKGDRVIVNIVLQGARIEFISAMLGRRVDNIPLYSLSWPDDYNRVQDRKFVRLPVIMDIFYAEVPKEGESPRYIKSSVQDISGGGVRMLVKNIYEAGTALLMKFNLLLGDKSEEIAVSGKVVRSGKISATAISAAVEFTNITNRQQDIIVRFILNRLAKSRKPR
ncbi:MAG: Flagellar brake protein YcgR [Pelotomaculum sp. PtaB.Bin013]|uniref:Flagellar brake domain-containing protein n=1 Tax=Pelotomaculum isophthalicicum JI TaxID=947010 RepID=A0A9X4GXP0_9FIRM|nr:flagellar brake domain-containing protein [Pelotomaculum isophthalicicum]MDF9407010.1 flagellar brake domain-containing protein [Pelotomaculum isophthalicicum JI]OPX90805.1 MAG: Flagellar brake protein YcgR [Pelotomaculum sp. PtaB.Bin013]